jgi:CRP-like cAMP-binding protein
MNTSMSITNETIKIEKDNVLCLEGDKESDLYFVTSGKLLICSRSGHMVTPLAYITKGDYFGEMSFFDDLPRSADVVALEDTTLVKVKSTDLKDQVPTWLLIIAKQMTHKLRTIDHVIRDKGIKRKNVESMKPLSIEEQRHYYQIISSRK